MSKVIVSIFILFIATTNGHAQQLAAPDAAPAWFLEEVATLTAGSGRWITDNAEYMSEQEPYEAYGIEWKASFDGTTMSGRLFGIMDGKEIGDFWEFRQFWHPERKAAILQQFGWSGTVGMGTHWREEGMTKSDQTFYAPGGLARRSGHESYFDDDGAHVTTSFEIVDDEWQAQRTYTWILQADEED